MELLREQTVLGATGCQNHEITEKSTESKIHKISERSTWANSVEFLLNVIGFTIGVGNVWRFPYLCYKNGGGAFLIPYLIVIWLAGFPTVLLDLSVGQYTGKSILCAWDIVPLMKGVGTSCLFMAWYHISYAMVLMGWFIFYFLHCFTTSPLPWSICDNWWNTNSCVPVFQPSSANITNLSGVANLNSNDTTSSMKEFWKEYVLQQTEGIHDMGSFSNWRMVLCFLCAWFISYFCILKGIRTSGKVAYFTVITPYVMFLILLVRGVMLEGAGDGIWYYVTPRMEKLIEAEVWMDAGGQALYTLGIGFLSLYTFGSHNKFHTNCYKFALINIVACCGTSVFVGFIIFAYLGNMAFREGKNITDVAEGGPGLVFQVFPVGLVNLPGSQIWSAIFFFTMILVVIDCAFAVMEGYTAYLRDLRPKWFIWPGQQACRIGMSVFPFLLGVPMLLDGGIYVFELVNMYGNSGIAILLIAFVEVIGISWLYGVEKFFDNLQQMVCFRPNIFLKYCYLYITPAITLCIFVSFCAQYSPLKNGNYKYPWWANAIGWILLMSVVAAIPIIALKSLFQHEGSLKQRWRCAKASRLKSKEREALSENVALTSGEDLNRRIEA